MQVEHRCNAGTAKFKVRKVSGGMEDLPKPLGIQKSFIIFTRVMNELDSHECIQAGRIKDTAGDCAMTCGKTATIGKFYLYYRCIDVNSIDRPYTKQDIEVKYTYYIIRSVSQDTGSQGSHGKSNAVLLLLQYTSYRPVNKFQIHRISDMQMT